MISTNLPKVLIVDDNRDNANIIRDYLAFTYGYQIVVAYNGDDALNVFEAEHPGIVLLDVMMPGRDGWEVCRMMKEHPVLGRYVRIIMVTALDDVANKRHALQTGADDFLEKPFNLTRLAATVRRNASVLQQSVA